jgi:hypothetical protein
MPPAVQAQDTIKIRCESRNGQRQECPTNTAQGVVLSKQLSAEGCWQGESWGTMPDAVWVSDNCRAEFTVGAPQGGEKGGSGGKTAAIVGGIAAAAIIGAIIAHNKNDDDDRWDHDDDYGWGGNNRTVRCESRRGRRNTCFIGRYNHVELRRQLSGDSCRRYRNWGTTRDEIWVDDGCRAEFWVRR